ncbi:MAG: YaiO family outer membrane beta-barrel protein [Candidatus Omnitrophota bacterium]
MKPRIGFFVRLMFMMLFMFLILFMGGGLLHAQATPAPPASDQPVTHRIEINWLMEYLKMESGESTPWKSLYLKYSGSPSPTFNYFVQLGRVRRDGKSDYIGIIGAARDWTDWFYTYSAVSAGTRIDYLPRLRFDQDFNFKFLRNRALVWTIGMAYIRYHIPTRNWILSTAAKLYLKKLILEYRLFRNQSNPGEVVSYTHLGSIGYGAEKKSWTFFNVSRGSQAYLAFYIDNPEQIRQNALNLSLVHRQWLFKNLGIELQFNYVDLEGGYQKYGIFSSLFLEL